MLKRLLAIISLLFVIISPCVGDIASSGYVDEMRDSVQAQIDKKAANSNYTQNSVLQTDTSGNVIATTAGTDLFADGAIQTMHLADGAVTNADLAGMIDITKLNLGTLPTSGKHMMIWNAETNKYVFEKLNNGLPDGYTRLEYIESTGTQYIDTGQMFLFGDGFYFEYMPRRSVSAENKGYGAGDVVYVNSISGGGRVSGSVAMFIKRSNAIYVPILSYLDTLNRHYVENWKISEGKLDSVLTEIGTNSTYTFSANSDMFIPGYQSGNSVYLFRDNNVPYAYYSAIRLYRTWLKRQDGRYAFNLIPAKRNSDGAIGMYDTVTETFFTNSGTGEFIAGPEI